MTAAGKQAIAKEMKGNYESFLIALFIWSKTKDKPDPKNKQETDELIETIRGLAHVVRNRLYDRMLRFEKSAVEVINDAGGISEFPEVDDPKWELAFVHSQNLVGNAIQANNANSGDGLQPEGNIIWEKEIGDLKYQRS